MKKERKVIEYEKSSCFGNVSFNINKYDYEHQSWRTCKFRLYL